ncbi:MAG: hypothetical protein HZB92_01000 [Euryarchaeota archaeon]|nr:hypothetical protein [Euryarchaeota archaeon]
MSGQPQASGTYPPPPLMPIPPMVPIAPFPGQAKKMGAFDTASLVLGILAICLHWVVIFKWGLILYTVPLVLSCLAVAFGTIAAHKILVRKKAAPTPSDKAGLAGFALGILSLMFATAWLLLAQAYLWGWAL